MLDREAWPDTSAENQKTAPPWIQISRLAALTYVSSPGPGLFFTAILAVC